MTVPLLSSFPTPVYLSTEVGVVWVGVVSVWVSE